MKISDNMLRVINHAYTNGTPLEFLIKTNMLQLKDEEIIVKAIEVAAMISKLIQHINTDTEKRFYEYKLSVEDYNRALIKERSISKNLVTIKEFITGNGLVYSEFLDYIYNSLARYEFTTPDKDILIKSLNKTHLKLQYILKLKGGVATGEVEIEDIKKELNRLDSLATEYKYSAEFNLNMLEDSTKSIVDNIKSIEDTIQGMAKEIDNIDSLDNYNFNSIDLMEKIDNKIKSKLLEKENAINRSIIKKLEDININSIEGKIADNISNSIQNLLDKLCNSTNIEIENKVAYLMATANNIGSNNILENVVKQLDNLYSSLEDIEINNKAYTDLIESNLDNINNRFR